MIKLVKDSWDKINIDCYEQLRKLKLNETDALNNLNEQITLLSILCEVDEDKIVELTTDEFKELLSQTTFLNELPKVKVQPYYTINGKEYEVFLNLKSMTVAQYLDFQTFYKEQDKYFKELLSIFVIPKGKKYNTDYNIEEVINEIGKNMSIVDAYSILFFFILLYQNLMLSTVEYSIQEMMKMKKNLSEEEKEKLKQAIMEMEKAKVLMRNGGGFIS